MIIGLRNMKKTQELSLDFVGDVLLIIEMNWFGNVLIVIVLKNPVIIPKNNEVIIEH